MFEGRKSEENRTDSESSSPPGEMDRFKEPKFDDDSSPPGVDGGDEDRSLREEDGGTPEPFAGAKVRRKASRYREHRGDYLHVSSRPGLMRILEKQG